MAYLTRYFVTLCLIASLVHCLASAGDRDPLFSACLAACKYDCSIIEQAENQQNDTNYQSINALLNQNHKNLIFSAKAKRYDEISFVDRLFDWQCPDLCAYDCMHLHTDWRLQRAANAPSTAAIAQDIVLKYYGKWPFRRLWGLQEFFSSIFSLFNLFPHLVRVIDYRAIPALQKYSLRKYWIVYGLVSINTWFWSAAFHARDRLWTERLDYYGASFGLIVSIIIQLIRTFHIQSTNKQALIFIVCMSLFCMHVGYLQFIHFDYGWNMTVSLATGVFYSGLCCLAAWYENRSYRRQVWIAHLSLWSAASFEVFDFPPFFRLFDAHAIWHGLTPPIVWLFWNITVKDSYFEYEREKKMRSVGQTPSGSTSLASSQQLGEQLHLIELGKDTDKLH